MVSIVTMYYNRADHVIESIESLLNQTYTDIEVIAIDDGSTDNTLEMLQSIKDSRLKVITQTNMGFVKSIIKAVSLASGEYIAIHGSGDISYKHRIERQAELLRSRPEVGVVSCHVENVVETTGAVSYIKPVIDRASTVTDQLIKANLFTHGEVMFRKSVYVQAGGYREFFRFCQDYDLWLRMSLLTQFAVVPEVLYKRYMLTDGVSASFDKIMMQKYFDELSIQCVELRRSGLPDLIDKYGNHGAFFRNPTARLATKLSRLAVIALYRGKTAEALLINRKSVKEKLRLSNGALHMLLLATNRSKLLHRMMIRGLNLLVMRKGRVISTAAAEQKQTA